MKQVLAFFLSIMLLFPPASALGSPADTDWETVKGAINAQTWQELANGVVTIPEAAINEYAAAHLAAYPGLRAAQIAIHDGNRLTIDLVTPQWGRLRINGVITRFIQNREESTISIRVTKRKLLDKPVTSWFLAQLSLSMLTKLFGNPLPDGQHPFTTQISGNTLTIDFKAFIEQSALNNLSIGTLSALDLITIEALTTTEGAVQLHAARPNVAHTAAVLRQLVLRPTWH